MSITPSQTNTGFDNQVVTAHTTRAVGPTVPFLSPNVSSNTVVVLASVLVGGGGGLGSPADTPNCADSAGNLYELIFKRDASFESGPGFAMFIANNIKPFTGNNITVTFTCHANGVFPGLDDTQYSVCVIIAEYPSLPNAKCPPSQTGFDSRFGSPRLGTVSVFDSQFNLVTATYGSTMPSANDWTMCLAIITSKGGGVDYAIAFGADAENTPPFFSPPTVTPISYGTFALETYAQDQVAVGQGYHTLYLWDQAQLLLPVPPVLLGGWQVKES